MTLTEEYILELYARFKRKSSKALALRRYGACLRYLGAACNTAYIFYMGFTDMEVEEMLQEVGKHLKRSDVFEPKHRCVFYDTFSQDAQGLTMQYVDAIIAAGWEMLYLTEFDLDDPRSIRLKQALNDYPKAKVLAVPCKLKGMSKVQLIYDTIMNYAPDKLFMHIHPSAVEAVTAFYALPKEITKYQINLTDHTYWVGVGCVDYSFEFRDYGASLSVGKRVIPKDRILLLPYYPMMKATEFAGFPKEAEGKVKIFSGASFYKIMDENDTFFKLNKAILDANPNAVTLFAGGGDMAMLYNLIEKYGLKGRFIPIGQRNDVFECYKHSDIYLSSFPQFGALMAQFAAHAELPILAYAYSMSGVVEEVVCQKHKEIITFTDMDALVSEASRLINDESYRQQRGQAIRNCVIGVEEFNSGFKASVDTKQSQYPLNIEENVKLHYLNIADKLKLENNTKGYQKSIYYSLGLAGLFTCPRVWFDGFMARIKSSRMGDFVKQLSI